MSIDSFSHLSNQAAALPVCGIETSRPVWIFGAGNFGRALARVLLAEGVAVAGFVETAPQSQEVEGMPVLDWSALARIGSQAQLVLGILNRGVAYDQLVSIASQAGFQPPLMPWELYDQFGQALGWRFWLGDRGVLASHLDRLAQIATRVGDSESRETLLRICAFRLGLDLKYSSFHSSERQYFNALTLPSLQGRATTYVDCGAYNGDTFIELGQQPSISCRQAFLLEPDPDNFAVLVHRMAGNYPQAICLPLAASDHHGILTFVSGQGEGSTIGLGGNVHVAAAALDQIVPQAQVDFIKLDVEGAEAQVLRGASRMIERCRPVLAASLYHKPEDIWELPELLFGLCQDYKFYIRQHACNSFESVLYAVPESR